MKNGVFKGWKTSCVRCYSRNMETDFHRGNGTAQRKSVVIIDDSAVVRESVGKAFLDDGFRFCGEASDGAEGIEVVKQLKPDLAVLDLSMPVMNGLQTAPILRRLFPHMVIILFSLHGDGLLKTEATRAGVDAVVSKSEDLPALLEKAHELLHM
jgi:DNA-binding NarL/FixJ family response regulator